MQPSAVLVTKTHFVQSTLYSSQVGNTIGAPLANHVLDWGIRNELEPIWLVALADTLNLSQCISDTNVDSELNPICLASSTAY